MNTIVQATSIPFQMQFKPWLSFKLIDKYAGYLSGYLTSKLNGSHFGVQENTRVRQW